jgi:hypothetical protein
MVKHGDVAEKQLLGDEARRPTELPTHFFANSIVAANCHPRASELTKHKRCGATKKLTTSNLSLPTHSSAAQSDLHKEQPIFHAQHSFNTQPPARLITLQTYQLATTHKYPTHHGIPSELDLRGP